MAAIAKLNARLLVVSALGNIGPFDLAHSQTAEVWFGPVNVVVPNGTSAQPLIVIGAQGIASIRAILITADQAITLFYNASAVGLPITEAGGMQAFSASTITSVRVTNVSGVSANVSYMTVGS